MTYDRKPCHNSGFLLWQISNMWQKRINDILSDHELTHVQYLLLATIVWMEKQDLPINQISLARQAQSHKMMTSKVVRSLVKAGLINRKKDLHDTRSFLIEITNEGREKYKSVKSIIKNADSNFFGKVERNRFSINKLFIDMLEENQLQIAS